MSTPSTSSRRLQASRAGLRRHFRCLPLTFQFLLLLFAPHRAQISSPPSLLIFTSHFHILSSCSMTPVSAVARYLHPGGGGERLTSCQGKRTPMDIVFLSCAQHDGTFIRKSRVPSPHKKPQEHLSPHSDH